MAGLTDQGLVIKRLPEVVTSLKEQAQPIFQDLVQPGDIVDTSDSSTLGRIIGLFSLPLSDIWEALQEVYSAFDPNAATGIALENIVAYGGLTKNPASPTLATVVIWGDPGTNIDTAQVARAIDNTLYNIAQPIILSNTSCIGVGIEIAGGVVVEGETYSVFVNIGPSTRSASYVAQLDDTIDIVYNNLINSLTVIPSPVSTSIDQSRLFIELNNIFEKASITTSSNINIVKIKERGEVRNQVVGFKEQQANEINSIATPLLGWDSINNPFDAIPGTNEETDEELRQRFRDSKYIRAINISDALYSSLKEVDGVRDIAIYENETDTPDPDYDLPGHSFKVVIDGGAPSEIAREIWKNKPLGISSEGNTYGTIVDSQGYSRNIYFERPIPVPIYIEMELTITNSSIFPSDGIEQIKAALINYFSENIKTGDDVIYSRLYTPINSVPGHQVNSLFIDKTPSPTSTNNIVIAYNEVASLNDANISVVIV